MFVAPALAILSTLHIAQSSEFQTRETKTITRVLQEFIDATLSYDAKKLETLTDPEYIEVSPIGEVDLRDRFLGFYRVPETDRPKAPMAGIDFGPKSTEAKFGLHRCDLSIRAFNQNRPESQ